MNADEIELAEGVDPAELAVYIGSDTDEIHQFLMGMLFATVTIEAFLLAIIVGAQTRSLEEQHGPGSILYTTKAGRAVSHAKLVAVCVATALRRPRNSLPP